MTDRKNQNFINSFLSNNKQYPVLVAIAAGLYPIFYYFTRNFLFVNSWEHLGFFSVLFILLPISLFVLSNKLFKIKALQKWEKYVLAFLNIFFFLFYLMICKYAGINKKVALLILPIALIGSYFLFKYLKKIVIIQLILAVIGLFSFVLSLLNRPVYSNEWTLQPDSISEAIFKTKPNVYLIQPDGYVSFSEIKKGFYQIDNSEFEEYLNKNGFTNYPNFRSNYPSTLASNTALFTMKHHYYNGAIHPNEALNARGILVSKNTVLDVFKNNGYKTHLIIESPYIMINRPKIGYDVSNISRSEIPFIGKGFNNKRDVFQSLKNYLEEETIPKFFFVEFFNPGHIRNHKSESKGKEGEKEKWKESLSYANKRLMEIIDEIKKHDNNGIIIILSDHGGYVGFDYSMQMYTKTTDRDLIYSIFGSNLSILWPDSKKPKFNDNFKSSVNVFRLLFSYLSENEQFLLNLQEDESYMVITKGAPKGIYKYIDTDGEITFEKKE